MKNKLLILLLAFTLIFTSACTFVRPKKNNEVVDPKEIKIEMDVADEASDTGTTEDENAEVKKGNSYYSMEDVSMYIHLYNELPPNYLTKKEASKLGWESREGNLWEVTDKGVIGGDRFGNREKILPTKSGRVYYECDVNYAGGHRGAERIVFSNDGLIFYTRDHYSTFEELKFD